jgi:hypothetical protein
VFLSTTKQLYVNPVLILGRGYIFLRFKINDQNKQPQAPAFMYGVRLFLISIFFRTNVPKNIEIR